MTRPLLLLACLLVAAPAAAAPYPTRVQAEIEDLQQSCASQGGRFAIGKDAVLTADFDGDRQPDYVINENGLSCSSSPGLYCGSGGCGVSVYLSSRRYNLAPDGGFLAHAASIDATRTPPRLKMEGRNGPWARVWNGQAFVAP